MYSSNDDFQRLQQVFEILCSMVGFSKDVTEELMTRWQREYVEDRGLRSLLGFISRGGKVEQVSISAEEADLFRERLQARHVSYYETEVLKNDGTVMHIFMYKGTVMQRGKEVEHPDKKQVKRIQAIFALEKSKASKELDLQTFRELIQGKTITVANNLSAEQVYAFRHNVSDTDIKFCVLADEDNTYKIYATNPEAFSKTMLRTCYDIANDEQGIYKSAVEDYITKRRQLFERCGNEPFIICSKDNPENFIRVTKNGYTCHSLQKRSEIQPDGSIKDVLRDVTIPTIHAMNRNELFAQAKEMKNPVIMSEEQFTILDTVNKKGVAFATAPIERFKEQYLQVLEACKEMETCVDMYPRLQPKYKVEDLDGYVHLPTSLVQQIKTDLPFIHTNDIDNIAFTKDQKTIVDKYLQTNVIDNISDPLQRVAFQWQIEGRTGNMRLTFQDIKEPFYLINPDDPKIVVRFDASEVNILHAGQVIGTHPNSSEQYQNIIALYTNPDIVANPIILSESEYQSENSSNIISERANHFVSNDVIEELINLEEIEKTELTDNIATIDSLDMTMTQEKAVAEYTKVNIHTETVTKTLMTELQTTFINRELQKDTEIASER